MKKATKIKKRATVIRRIATFATLPVRSNGLVNRAQVSEIEINQMFLLWDSLILKEVKNCENLAR